MRAGRFVVVAALLATACSPSTKRAQPTPSPPTPTGPSPVATATGPSSPSAPASRAAPPTAGLPSTSVTRPAEDACGPAVTPGSSEATFRTPGGATRRYVRYLPQSYDGTTAVPLVLNLHGYGWTADLQQVYSGLAPVAEREGFALVALEGQGRPPHYNVREKRHDGEESDVAVAEALVDHLAATVCIDRDRVYAAGMSNGGALAATLACFAGDRFAAVAAVAAVVYDPSCDGGPPVPIIVFRGTADPIVPYAGGVVRCCGSPRVNPTEQDVRSWARHNRCAAKPVTRTRGKLRTVRYTRCAGGADVVLHAVTGGGHTWPGAVAVPGVGETTREISASAELWRFFESHPRR